MRIRLFEEKALAVQTQALDASNGVYTPMNISLANIGTAIEEAEIVSKILESLEEVRKKNAEDIALIRAKERNDEAQLS